MMFPRLRDLKEPDMRVSSEFEAQAMIVFSIFDDVIENLDTDIEGVLEKLEELARLHAKIEGFSCEFFKVSYHYLLVIDYNLNYAIKLFS